MKRPTRGRPPQDAPRPQHQVWHVTWQGPEATDAISLRAQRERRGVLATNGLGAQHLSDAELLQADTGQPAAALRCKSAKHLAAIAPMCLETPRRMAALGCVYMLALVVSTVVERQVRNSLGSARGNLVGSPRAQPAPDGPPRVPAEAPQRGRHPGLGSATSAPSGQTAGVSTPRDRPPRG